MADGQLRAVIGQLRRLIGGQGGSTLTDAQLLEAFVSRRDEAAFEVLVWRHGTMVFNLCQRVLRDAHQAEDAFQATFLVLVRKAGSIGKRESLGSWLYKVAYRIACRARAKSAKDARSGADADILNAPDRSPADDLLWRDLRPVLDEEINRLPEKYRTPFVLCHMQGHTNEEAAQLLGCPKGTILSRLARGRERLRARLVQRGLALSAAWLATHLSSSASCAAVPAALVTGTVKASLSYAAGVSAAGLVAASVASLTDGVLHAMFLAKVKMAAAAVLTLAILGAGAGALTHWGLAENQVPSTPISQAPLPEKPVDKPVEQPREPAKPAEQPVPPVDELPQTFTGKVIAVAAEGKGIVLEIPGSGRREERTKQESTRRTVTFGPRTVITYNGVGPNGARPTEGYTASVRTDKEEVISILFQTGESTRAGPNLTGTVEAVSRDEKGVTLEEGVRGRDRNEAPKKTELRFNDKTLLVFSAVSRGNAKITAGYRAQVWLTDDPQGNVVAKAQFTGPEVLLINRGDAGPDVSGRVVGVSRDGKTLTLADGPSPDIPAFDVKLDEETAIVFQNVGVDGARISEGQQAAVWFAPGSTNKASKVGITGVVPERWPTVSGNVVAVSQDASVITLEIHTPQIRGGTRGEPRENGTNKIDIRLTPRTHIIYQSVGPDEATLMVGFAAVVRLADGSRDTAAQIMFTKPGARER